MSTVSDLDYETAVRERAAFLDERNQTRAELAAVRELMNALAVHCDKLEKNQLPAGAVCFVPTGEVRRRRKGDWYRWQDQAGDSLLEWTVVTDDVSGEYPIYRRVEAQGEGAVNGYRDLLDTLAAIASKCGITEPGSEPKQLLSDNVKQHFDSIVAERDALRQEVERLKAESKANQEAADVLRLIEENEMTVKPMKGFEELPTRWRVASPERTIAAATADTVAKAVKLLIDLSDPKPGITLPARDDEHIVEPNKMVLPQPAAEKQSGKFVVSKKNKGWTLTQECDPSPET